MSEDIMETFRQTYLEESFEGLDIMEAGLLDIPIGSPDLDKVNEIFRAAHSIKGGSGTFGFSEISGFTHVLETILDEMRDGTRNVTQDAVDILLESVDVLRDMLEKLQAHEDIDGERASDVQSQMEAMLSGGSKDKSGGNEGVVSDSKHGAGEWIIGFTPKPGLLQTGNEPLRIFRELETLGELTVSIDQSGLEALGDEFNPENLYLSWELSLSGQDIEKSDIEEVFEWIDEDDALVDIQPVLLEAEPVQAASKESQDSKDKKPSPNKARKPSSKPAAKASKPEGSIRVDLNKIDYLVNLVGELVITQSMLGQFGVDAEQGVENINDDWVERLKEGLSHLERHTRDLQESVMGIRMLPVSFAFNRMPRIVHDVSKKLNKDIELVTEGEGVELDKTMLEKLTDPLVHIVRNSIDHGVETPDVRSKVGKPATGTVKLAAFHSGGSITIEITDDGAGIDARRIESKALEKGVISDGHGLSQEEIIDLIFHPGFSTAEVVSDISGRGVGMDVVRRNIRELGGSVAVKTKLGEGSVFTIRLPLTLAILDGQLCSVKDETYVLPLSSIIESIQIDKKMVKSVAGEGELYNLRGEYIPIIRLQDRLEVDSDSGIELEDGLLVVIEESGEKSGIFVDQLQSQQQVVIKSLETNFTKVSKFAGATILGNGKVALILDIKEIVHRA